MDFDDAIEAAELIGGYSYGFQMLGYLLFKNKKLKHIAYNSGVAPVNYFAFCVPLDMYDKCKEFLDKNYPKYGLFIYSNHSVCQDRISVFSRKKLLTERTTTITKDSVAKQMAIHIVYGN